MKQAGSNGVGTGGELKSWCDKHGKVQVREPFFNFSLSLSFTFLSREADWETL